MENLTTGQRIAECRKEKGLSQEALGEKMGVSRQAISKWEADAAMPDVDKLIALSRLFSITQEFWAASQTDMQFPELQNNDRLELWFEAELENGISCAVKVDSWVYRAGEFMWEN